MTAISGLSVGLLLLVGAAVGVRAACTTAPPEVDGMTLHVVVEGAMAVYMCADNKPYTTGDTAIVVYCVDGDWQETAPQCDIDKDPVPECAEKGSSDATYTIEPVVKGYVDAYICNGDGFAWLSGEPKRISQCRNGEWVPIMDICDEVCEIPRDCHEVEQLGFTTSNYYIVIPSGNALDSNVKVYCELSSTDEGGGHWTRVLFNAASDMTDSTGTQYETGYYGENDIIFLGVSHLHSLSFHLNGTVRPQVLEVILYIEDQMYFAAYDNFTVGSSTDAYPIASLGTYHGNAGDALCPHLLMGFSRNGDNIGWWGEADTRDALIVEEKGCLLTNSSMFWLPLKDVGKVTNVTMRIRPLEYDNKVNCPPMVGLEPYWTTTNGSWTLVRNESFIITWNCIGEMMMEPSTTTDKGVLQCIASEDGTLAWNDTIELPCRLHCPESFNASYDERRCYHFAAATDLVAGLHQAAVKCMDLNASVAALVDGKDLYQAEADVQYYTAHTGLGLTAVYPPIPLNDSFINCSDAADCDLLGDKNCLTITSNGSATPVGCNETFSYACQLPVHCPEGYVKAGGSCYTFREDPMTLSEGEVACNAEGGSLAYPNSPMAVSQMAMAFQEFRNESSSASEPAPAMLVGVNSRLGDFTAGSLYPEATNLNLEKVEDPYYALAMVDNGYDLTVQPGVEVSEVSSEGIICQWPGVIGCYFPSPEQLANMTSNGTDPANYTIADFNDVITYSCEPGYFVDGNISLAGNQSVSCLGPLGSWQPPLLGCARVAVCEGMSPTVKSPGVTNETDTESWYIGGNVTYSCPDGMALANATTTITNQTLTCSENSSAPGTYGFFPEFQECLACLGEPPVVNATSDYSDTSLYVYNTNLTDKDSFDHVMITCNDSYEIEFNVTEQKLYCTENSWNLTGILPCRIACMDMPPAPGENMTLANLTERWLGSEVTYTCNPGTHLEANGSLPVEETTVATCDEAGVWVTQRHPDDLNCYPLATSDPQVPPEGVNYTWAGDGTDNRREGAVVTYTCPEGKLFMNRTSSLNSTNVNGTWTPIASLECYTACLDDPPPDINGANTTWSGLPSWVDDVLTYTCPEGHATDYGAYNESITCTDSGTYEPVDQTFNMTSLMEMFLCEPACPGPPLEAPAYGDSDYVGNFTEGTVVVYRCIGSKFVDGSDTVQSNCTDGNWTLTEMPDCDVTTSSPSTEPTVIEAPSPPYDETADTYYSVLQNNMTDTDGENATYIATDAPFGFGYAVRIESAKKQCLQVDFSKSANMACMSNPSSCSTNGLSFSIWERHTFSQDEFIRSSNGQLTDKDIKYVLSTGGDVEGHPGIAFYHKGVFQHVVVSTGDEFWHVRVPGLMENGTWANIGIRWNPNTTENSNGEAISGGLELFINKKLEGRSFYPQTSSGAKPGLEPFELMLGCHKTNTSDKYRHFGDGEYDELAFWKRALADNETDNFLGGYMADLSHLTPKQMSEKLANIDMKNPEALGVAMVALGQMTEVHERPTSSPDTTTSDIASLASSSPTPAGPNSLEALEMAKKLEQREDLLNITELLFAEENAADVLTYAQADKLLSGLNVVSNLMSPDSASEWKTIQENGSAGAASLMWNGVSFARRTFCSIRYTNNTKPFTIIKGYDNIIFYGQKMLYEDLKARGRYVQIPDYSNDKLKPYKNKWNQVFDMGRVMTNVLNDDHCDKRPVCLVTIVFDSYDDIGPCPVNIANIPGDRTNEMGTRLLYGSLSTDKARDASGKVNYSAPLCQLDKFTMSRNPFYTKLENKVRVPALRQLRFHSDEVVTKVNTRRCAYWNEKLSDYGAWDTDGCQVVESNEMYTKCTCDKFGSIIVLDEKVEEPAVPPEPSWLHIVKLVLYCISAVVLVFYCIVVAYSSDLKEQFHLMGMYLSISVLIGSISMLVSDLDAIRDSRHLCTTLGTITHYFYVAAGLWVACLGHASFKAITSGEVGGKLNSYSCIAWGVAMFSVGVPYAFFVRHLGTDPRCFITWENDGKAAFFLPQAACVCIAFFFGIVVLFNLSTPALRKENLVEDYGSFCRGAAFVMIYFAFTWTFGLLAYMRFGLSVDFYPLFQVFNSAMGIIIIIFIGIASHRFRTVLVGKAKSRHEKIKNLAGIKKSKLEEEQPSPKRPRSTSNEDKMPERPATQSSLHPPQRGQVAGRPGSRPVTPNQ